MPSPSARWMRATASSSPCTLLVYVFEIPMLMQPRPIAETSGPRRPSFRCFMVIAPRRLCESLHPCRSPPWVLLRSRIAVGCVDGNLGSGAAADAEASRDVRSSPSHGGVVGEGQGVRVGAPAEDVGSRGARGPRAERGD